MVNFSIFSSTLFTGQLRFSTSCYKDPNDINIRLPAIFVNYFFSKHCLFVCFYGYRASDAFLFSPGSLLIFPAAGGIRR